MDTILEFLKNNQIASGGLVIGIFAFLYQHGMRILNVVSSYIKRSTFVTYHFSSMDGYDLYYSVDAWLKDLINNKRKNIRDISVKQDKDAIYFGRYFLNVPNLGLAYITISSEDLKSNDNMMIGTKVHKISITICKQNKLKLKNIIHKFKEKHNSDNVYHIQHANHLGDFPKKHINLNTVILDKQFSSDLFQDLSCFLKSKEKYYTLGNTYKRIYLLHGAPGNGKTSIIKLISNYLDYSIVISSFSEVNSTHIRDCLEYANNKALFVFEDIDREDLSEKDSTKLNTLLNIFDGLATPECIIIMTCNDITKLDPALIRPGRVDRIFEIKNATKDQVQRMFLKYYPKEQNKISNAVQDYPCYLLSMSKIQECLQLSTDIDSAIDRLKEYIKK